MVPNRRSPTIIRVMPTMSASSAARTMYSSLPVAASPESAPKLFDTDADGIPDYVDIDSAGGPGGGDSDGDGTTDLIECPAYLLGCPDIDSDGLPDYLDDNHQDGPLGDIDADGLANYLDPDDDGDGMHDLSDNCPLDANPDQADANSNGLGDACEAIALLSPADGATGLDTTLTFTWKVVTHPNPETLSYQLLLCDNPDFVGCEPTDVAWIDTVLKYASSEGILPLVFFGSIMGGIGLRRKKWLIMTIYSLAIIGLISSCGDGGVGDSKVGGNTTPAPTDKMSFTVSGLKPATDYYWKVAVSDGVTTVESAIRSFTTR